MKIKLLVWTALVCAIQFVSSTGYGQGNLTLTPPSATNVIMSGLNLDLDPERYQSMANFHVAAATGASQVNGSNRLWTTNGVMNPQYLVNTPYNSYGPDLGTTHYGGSLIDGLVIWAVPGTKITLDSVSFRVTDSAELLDSYFTSSGFFTYHPLFFCGIVKNSDGTLTYLRDGPIIATDGVFISQSIGLGGHDDPARHQDTMDLWSTPFNLTLENEVKGRMYPAQGGPGELFDVFSQKSEIWMMVPEPSTMLLGILGASVLLGLRMKKKAS